MNNHSRRFVNSFISNLYNEKKFDEQKMMKAEILVSENKSELNKFKVVSSLKATRKTILTALIAMIASLNLYTTGSKIISDVQNKELIDEYNEYVDDYITNNEFEKLSDYEIVLKVMKDLYENGLQRNNKDVISDPYNLKLSILDNKGVCRNISDDIAHKLNQINKDYDALVVFGHLNNDQINDWRSYSVGLTNYVDDKEESNESTDEVYLVKKDSYKFLESQLDSNHAVTFVNMPGTDVVLIVDGMNGGTGVLLNGNMYFFNSPEAKMSVGFFISGVTYDITTNTKLYEYILKSYQTKETYEELEQMYGYVSSETILNNFKSK